MICRVINMFYPDDINMGRIVFSKLSPLIWKIWGSEFKTRFDVDLEDKQKILLISNHPSYFDAFSILWWADKHNRMDDLLFVAKDSVKYLPFIGNLFARNSLLLKRNIEEDKENIIEYCQNLNKSDKPYIFLIFPEGTTYADSTIKKSKQYTDKNGLVEFVNVLCPRTTGIELIMQNLKFDVFLDMTIIYNDFSHCYGTKTGFPFAYSKGFLLGNIPLSIEILVQEINIKSFEKINTDNDFVNCKNIDKIRDLIMGLWRQKDMVINNIKCDVDLYYKKLKRMFITVIILAYFFQQYYFY